VVRCLDTAADCLPELLAVSDGTMARLQLRLERIFARSIRGQEKGRTEP
jgi:hypothetical protein